VRAAYKSLHLMLTTEWRVNGLLNDPVEARFLKRRRRSWHITSAEVRPEPSTI
jgi:hypothetical protein